MRQIEASFFDQNDVRIATLTRRFLPNDADIAHSIHVVGQEWLPACHPGHVWENAFIHFDRLAAHTSVSIVAEDYSTLRRYSWDNAYLPF